MNGILLTGGAGFIGSMVNLALQRMGYNTLVIDNLSSGDPRAVMGSRLIQEDLLNQRFLEQIFEENQISAVMHFAALTDVGESVANPALYYQNNVCATLSLLEAMRKKNVRTLVFSSSAAVYGIPETDAVIESSPCSPINPYGTTKWMVEKILLDYQAAYGINFCALRYFNAAGGDPLQKLKHYKKKESNLIPVVLNAVKTQMPVPVFGTDYPTFDGTCIRDYIHVADLAEAHILAMKKLLAGETSPCYNLGNGQGFSVREVIRVAEEVTGQKIPIEECPARKGDPPILLANAKKAEKELGWKPRYPELKTMIQHAWKARN